MCSLNAAGFVIGRLNVNQFKNGSTLHILHQGNDNDVPSKGYQKLIMSISCRLQHCIILYIILSSSLLLTVLEQMEVASNISKIALYTWKIIYK
jgi:hypothetical protein